MYFAPSPDGREAKPEWQQIPHALRRAIDEQLGSPVVEAEIAWGGYSPSASYHLTLADGSRAFAKGTHPGQTREGHAMMLAEITSYRDLQPISRIACGYRGSVDQEDWHLLLLDRLDGVSMLDAEQPAHVTALLTRYLAFQQDCAALSSRPDWLVPGPENPLVSVVFSGEGGWLDLNKPEVAHGFETLFEDPQAARNWMQDSVPALIERQQAITSLTPQATPWGVLHVDMRSDNILILPDGSARLIDWPNTCEGPIASDLSGWMPSLMAEGGPTPDRLIAEWHDLGGPQIEMDHIITGLTRISGYFMDNAWKPCPPALPRLRWVQKRQLFAALPWLCSALDLPPPPAPKQEA
ncbi:MAG: hypothetical protein Alpg2KO_12830 [Alphaproteobacteria bacterium]